MSVEEEQFSLLDVARGNAPADAPIHDLDEHAAFAHGDAVILPMPKQGNYSRRGSEQGNPKQPKPHRRKV